MLPLWTVFDIGGDFKSRHPYDRYNYQAEAINRRPAPRFAVARQLTSRSQLTGGKGVGEWSRRLRGYAAHFLNGQSARMSLWLGRRLTTSRVTDTLAHRGDDL